MRDPMTPDEVGWLIVLAAIRGPRPDDPEEILDVVDKARRICLREEAHGEVSYSLPAGYTIF